MKPEVQPDKIVVRSGSGISAESGLPIFRDSHGLWKRLCHRQMWECPQRCFQ
ncbi:Sir2 family NAD-dependent protein deacetylase [Janthinobacterium sp. JC611]|uniref:Sir2 family NAD-dependent protein deacetylase n=1 Tax=Janthinobacterium sp. JC611 TaxID=2816201 RepID=UPI001BFE52C1|nr:Sir2 family NAD-dependent protein deacetylase [Janthinobacterium sp. JC611]